MERGWKPSAEISPSCPRCGSSNTKFCYYNNYSLTQPRYFCKGCRRYWTKGGSLRNVPVGGGCRKNRKSSKSVRSSSSNADSIPSRSLTCAGVANIPTVRHLGPSSTGNVLMESTSSSMMSDNDSNIDLALVYANYLNPKITDRRNDFEMPELHYNSDIPPVANYSSSSNTNVGSSSTSPEDVGGSGSLTIFEQPTKSPFLEIDQMFLSGSSLVQKHQNTMGHYTPSYDGIHFEMSPLPGEEASQELMWSNAEMMLTHEAPTRQSPGAFDIQDADLLIGNWSPFRMSKERHFPQILSIF